MLNTTAANKYIYYKRLQNIRFVDYFDAHENNIKLHTSEYINIKNASDMHIMYINVSIL